LNTFVWFVILLAWTPAGEATKDSGVRAATTLEICHMRSLNFARKHGTVIQLCKRIPAENYAIISSGKVIFDHSGRETPEIEPYVDPEVHKLRDALAAIGKLHRGKTLDSQRVRAIIRKVR